MPGRFAHVGDLHLDDYSDNFDDCVAALDAVIIDALSVGVLAWFWPGDLCHKAMGIRSKNVLVSRVQQMANVAPVIIIKGNHDKDGDLDFLTELETAWPVHVINDPKTLLLDLPTGEQATVFCLPYPNKGALVAAGADVAAVAHAALDTLILNGVSEGAEHIRTCSKEGRQMPYQFMLGHVSVAGSVASTGQPQIGNELEVDQATLKMFATGYVGLNHIHKHQVVSNAVYAGSLCRLDWGETERKGWIVIEAEPMPSAFSWAFREIKVPARWHVEGNLTAADGFAYEVRKGPDGQHEEAPESWTGDDVRVRVRYQQTESAMVALQLAGIKNLFSGARRVDVEPIVISDRQVRAPEVIAETTVKGKLQAWARLSEIPWTSELDACIELLLNTPDDQMPRLSQDVGKHLREELNIMEER